MLEEGDLSFDEAVGDGSETVGAAHEAESGQGQEPGSGQKDAGAEKAPEATQAGRPSRTYTADQLRRTVAREVARVKQKYEALETWRGVVEFFEGAGPGAKMKLQQLLHELHGSGVRPAVTAQARDPLKEIEAKLAYRDAVAEIADADELFRKHKDEFFRWCEDEGFEEAREDPRALKLAYRAWRHDPTMKAALSPAKLQGPKSRGAPGGKALPDPKDARKMGDLEFLQKMGISLEET